MLIERTIEENMRGAFAAVLPDAEVIASRSPAAAGYVKGEADSSASQIVAVSLGARQYDEFSRSTLNFTGAITLSTRVEMCPTGEEHEDALEEILSLLTYWHSDAEAMTDALSCDGFYAAGLRLDGGQGKTFDRQAGVWTETISFTLRGAFAAE